MKSRQRLHEGRDRGRVRSLLALLLLAAACRGGDQQPHAQAPADTAAAGPPPADTPSAVGRWRGAHDQVELFANGRLLLHQGAYRVAGTYELVEPRRMLLIYQNALAAVPPGDYRVAVTKDSLTFCESDSPSRCVAYVRMTAADTTRAPGPVALDPSAADYGSEPRLAAPLLPDQLPPEARAKEADGVLKQAYTLQQTYRAEFGHYAVNMDSLRVVGWQVAPLRHFRSPEIVRADERLCIVVRPRVADLWPVHIDESGTLGRGASCR